MTRSINPHLSLGFHPKVAQVLELCNRHEQWKPQKKTLFQARKLEMRSSAC